MTMAHVLHARRDAPGVELAVAHACNGALCYMHVVMLCGVLQSLDTHV